MEGSWEGWRGGQNDHTDKCDDSSEITVSDSEASTCQRCRCVGRATHGWIAGFSEVSRPGTFWSEARCSRRSCQLMDTDTERLRLQAGLVTGGWRW